MKSRSQEALTRKKRRDTWNVACNTPRSSITVEENNNFSFSYNPHQSNEEGVSSSRLKSSSVPNHFITGVGSIKDTIFSYFDPKFSNKSSEETYDASVKQEYCLFCTPFGPIAGMITTSLSSIIFQPDPRCQEVKDLGFGQFQVFIDINDVLECGAAMIPGGPFLTQYLGFPHERHTLSSLESPPTPGFFQILTQAKCQSPTSIQRELCSQDSLTLYLMDLNALMYTKPSRHFSSNLHLPARDEKKKKNANFNDNQSKKDSTSLAHSEKSTDQVMLSLDLQALSSDHQHTLLLFRFADHEKAKEHTHFLINAIDKNNLGSRFKPASLETVTDSRSTVSFVPLSSNLILDILLLPPAAQQEEILERAKKHAARNATQNVSTDSLPSLKSDQNQIKRDTASTTNARISSFDMQGHKHSIEYPQHPQMERLEEENSFFHSQKYKTIDVTAEPDLNQNNAFSNTSKNLTDPLVTTKSVFPLLSRSLFWSPIIKPIKNAQNHRNVPCLLSYRVAAELCTAIPPVLASRAFVLKFCTQRDGLSYTTFFRRLLDAGPAIFLITDMNGELFGGFCSVSVQESSRYYGTGETFVFTFKELEPKANKEILIHAFHWTSRNFYTVLTNSKSIVFGGGNAFALTVDSSFLRGSSYSSETFMNPPLASENDFVIQNFQVWCFTDP